ncbi:putative hydroxyacylglutathione hydrolase [Cooperia oncophora]
MQSALRGLTGKMIKVIPIRALEDNYMYLVYSEKDSKGFAVDPVEPQKVKEVAENCKVTVAAALVTHHHWDHAGGMSEFRKIWKSDEAEIYGGDERIDHLNNRVDHEEKFQVGQMEVTALKTPCHTKGHICYYVTHPDSDNRIVLTGDTLFIAGCGKFFEGHEYTYSNLKFAHHIEPSNEYISLTEREEQAGVASRCRERNEPTVPSTIAEEKEINPFMRTTSAEIQKNVGATDLIEVMARVRQAKNSFRG